MVTRTYNTQQTLGSGLKVIPIEVTTTATSLGDLINAASAGRVELPGRRQLFLHNTDETAVVYILEDADQTVSDGWEVAAGEKIGFIASETFTDNDFVDSVIPPPLEAEERGFYLAVTSGTAIVKVLEAI